MFITVVLMFHFVCSLFRFGDRDLRYVSICLRLEALRWQWSIGGTNL